MGKQKVNYLARVSWDLKNVIYQLFLRNGIITYEDLENKGCDVEQIRELLEDGFLVVEQELEFSISSDGLYRLGVHFRDNKKYEEALKCFEKCLEMDSNYYLAIYRLIYENIKTWKFEDIYKFIRQLYQINNPHIRQVANLYLYLLAFFSPIPDGYLKEKLEQATLELKDTRRPVMVKELKEIKEVVLQGRGHYVIRKGDLDSQPSQYSEYFNTAQEAHELKQLIFFASALRSLIPLAQTRRYEELRELLEKRENILDNEDKVLSYCLKIVNIILRADEVEFETNSTDWKSTFEAIDQGDYYGAVKSNVSFRYDAKKDLDNLFSMLLFDLIERIGRRKKKKTYKENSESERITIDHISLSLKEEDFEKFLSFLRRYLIQIDELDKYELIALETMLLVLRGKTTYKEIIDLLVDITAGEYKFDEESYREKYQQYVSTGKNKQAEVILSILGLYGTGEKQGEYETLKKQLQNSYIDASTEQVSSEASEKYNKLLKIYTTKNQMYHDLSGFIKESYPIIVLAYPFSFDDDLRLKKDIWFENRDAGLDIVIVGEEDHSIALLRKVCPKEEQKPNSKTEYFNNLINELNDYLDQQRYGECINKINELLAADSFYLYFNEVTINIFVTLIKAYLGLVEKECCLGFDYSLIRGYLSFIRAINKKEYLGLDSKIEEVAKLIEASGDRILEKLWELADNWAYTIKDSKLDLYEGIADIKGTDEIPEEETTVLMIKVAYALRLHANRAAYREQILTEVRRNKMYQSCASFIEGKISNSEAPLGKGLFRSRARVEGKNSNVS